MYHFKNGISPLWTWCQQYVSKTLGKHILSSCSNSLGTEDTSCWTSRRGMLPYTGFQLFDSAGFSFLCFSCHDPPRVSICRRSGLQEVHFSTWTFPLWSHAAVTAKLCGLGVSCWNTSGLQWKRFNLDGTICWSKTWSCVSRCVTGITAHPYYQRCRNLNSPKSQLTTRVCPFPFIVQRPGCSCFPQRISDFNLSDHRTLFLFASVHYELWSRDYSGGI